MTSTHRALDPIASKRRARSGVSKIQGFSAQLTRRTLVGQCFLFELEDSRQIDLDPAQLLRQREAVGASVQPGGEIQHAVATIGSRLLNVLVDDLGSSDDRPTVAQGPELAQLLRDAQPMFAGQLLREWIVEQGIRS